MVFVLICHESYKESQTNIYNGIIFSFLNPVTIFQLNSLKPLTTSSSAVGKITCIVINT